MSKIMLCGRATRTLASQESSSPYACKKMSAVAKMKVSRSEARHQVRQKFHFPFAQTNRHSR